MVVPAQTKLLHGHFLHLFGIHQRSQHGTRIKIVYPNYTRYKEKKENKKNNDNNRHRICEQQALRMAAVATDEGK